METKMGETGEKQSEEEEEALGQAVQSRNSISRSGSIGSGMPAAVPVYYYRYITLSSTDKIVTYTRYKKLH
jgi:hypothetical protein